MRGNDCGREQIRQHTDPMCTNAPTERDLRDEALLEPFRIASVKKHHLAASPADHCLAARPLCRLSSLFAELIRASAVAVERSRLSSRNHRMYVRLRTDGPGHEGDTRCNDRRERGAVYSAAGPLRPSHRTVARRVASFPVRSASSRSMLARSVTSKGG